MTKTSKPTFMDIRNFRKISHLFGLVLDIKYEISQPISVKRNKNIPDTIGMQIFKK